MPTNTNGLQELKKKTPNHHFGLNVIELNEIENYVVFFFSHDYEEKFEQDVALTILGKKPVTITSFGWMDHPLFVSALKDPSAKDKVFAMRIGHLVNNKLDTYIVYTKKHKDDAILQALNHSFKKEINKKMTAFIFQVLENLPKKHSKIIIEDKIGTYITGFLFGYSDDDIMAYINDWGIGKKSGVRYFRKDIQKRKEEMKMIKRIALQAIKNMKASEFFAYYRKKASEIEMPMYKLISKPNN